jgi:CRISPR-associated protein Cmr2
VESGKGPRSAWEELVFYPQPKAASVERAGRAAGPKGGSTSVQLETRKGTMANVPNDSNEIWRAKLAAWTHDPAEKALVLLRDVVGHERGTVAELRRKIFGSDQLPPGLEKLVRKADHWASAADRPQFPQALRVRFDQSPVLIHPLDGEKYDLRKLDLDIDVAAIRAVSLDHFQDLVVTNANGSIDLKLTFLSFWRRGPESPAHDLGALWQVLPADTRVPTHSIWEHLSLSSALAGAMAADPDGNIALLKVGIGPVQSFIEQSRTTSDLWAGSHLLSRVMWEGLKVLCDEFGPDCMLFPDLHGVPLVDVWLKEHDIQIDSPALTKTTDENPLFVAAVVNLAVAIVPESRASELAGTMTGRMRQWVEDCAREAARRIHEETGMPRGEAVSKQIKDQLRGFPETFWTAVPWRLVEGDGGGSQLDVSALGRVLGEFYPDGSRPPGFFGSDAWRVLSQPILVEEAEFYRPNPGVAYPAIHDLADRSYGAAKSARFFEPIEQAGYRCTLCGEREWLTAKGDELQVPRGSKKRENVVWQRLAETKRAWAREGEYLCALCTLKRLWPSLFRDEVKSYLKDESEVSRFVISTHTMALARTLEKIVKRAANEWEPARKQTLDELVDAIDRLGRDKRWAALPALLHRGTQRLGNADDLRKLVRGLPGLLDQAAEEEEEGGGPSSPATREWIESRVKTLAGEKPEHYYALILMDGDRMGAWVSGTDQDLVLRYQETWHPRVRQEVELLLSRPELKGYAETQSASPSRHAAISRALNGFAVHLARHVVEEMHMGKLLYAGGDDAMALVSIDDLLDLLWWLRCAYSGDPEKEADHIRLGSGHALLSDRDGQKRLLRVMGQRASASIGAVVAHYSAPLQAVMRELRKAEKRAKKLDGKNAFSVTLMKRAGGLTHFTAKWWVPGWEAAADSPPHTIAVLKDLQEAFAGLLSRQAAYQALEWLSPLGEGADSAMVESLIRREFRRHLKDNLPRDLSREKGIRKAEDAANTLVRLAEGMQRSGAIPEANWIKFIRDAITLAEFLAREGRAE